MRKVLFSGGEQLTFELTAVAMALDDAQARSLRKYRKPGPVVGNHVSIRRSILCYCYIHGSNRIQNVIQRGIPGARCKR